MRNRLLRTALIGALCAASGCATPDPAATPIDQYASENSPPQSVASTFSLRVSSYSTAKTERYQVPPDFDGDLALHPYTSLLGPCPEGVLGAHCVNTILPSHYNR